jgi:hypothetical protein
MDAQQDLLAEETKERTKKIAGCGSRPINPDLDQTVLPCPAASVKKKCRATLEPVKSGPDADGIGSLTLFRPCDRPHLDHDDACQHTP